MKSKGLKIPAIIIAIGIIVAIAAGLLVSMQKMPTVTKQDFDFSITYKLDGETKTINGVYVSRFTGFGANGVDPLCRYYEGTYTVEGETDGDRCFTISEKDGYTLYIVALLNDSYLFGDVENDSYESGHEEPTLEAEDKDGNQYDETNLPDVFDAEIVSFQYPEPIENSLRFSHIAMPEAEVVIPSVIIAFLAMIATLIFVKKDADYTRKPINTISTVFNFIIGFTAFPFCIVFAGLLNALGDIGNVMNLMTYLLPALTILSIAASIGLRRKSYGKNSLAVQFVSPAAFVAIIIISYCLNMM